MKGISAVSHNVRPGEDFVQRSLQAKRPSVRSSCRGLVGAIAARAPEMGQAPPGDRCSVWREAFVPHLEKLGGREWY